MLIHSHIRAGAGKILLLALLWTAVSAVPAWAQYTPAAWPVTFIDYTDSTGSYIQDVSDQNPSYTDIIFSSSTPSSVAVACDGTTAFFRIQLAENPWRTGGQGSWAPYAWVVAMSDSSGSGAPVGHVSVTASGSTLDVEINDTNSDYIIYTYAKTNANPAAVRSVQAGLSGYYYIDFQVPIAALTTYLGIDIYSTLRFFYGSSASGGTINKDYMTGSAVDFLGLTTTNFSGIYHGGLTPNPVELTAFTAHVKDQTTLLRWRTASELNNFGFEVERSTDAHAWEMIGFVPGAGTSSSPRSYDFADRHLPLTGAIRYRLRQVDRDGSFEYSPIVLVHPGLRNTQGITGSFPSPARSQTTVNYTVTTPGNIALTIHDLAGRQVKQLAENNAEVGTHSATFDVGTLPRGMYLLHLRQAETIHVHPLLVTR
ncbi:MAG: T9SS type A sorting domain-containing protein [Bacteroidetes bacterium]|nr:T9SS type A sorting domain-containing protein [Bacteroidota bacterium]